MKENHQLELKKKYVEIQVFRRKSKLKTPVILYLENPGPRAAGRDPAPPAAGR